MINVNSSKLMSHYLVLLILELFPARLATLPYGLDSNVTQLLANLITKPSVFYYLPIVPCNIVSIKLLLLLCCSFRVLLLSSLGEPAVPRVPSRLLSCCPFRELLLSSFNINIHVFQLISFIFWSIFV